MLLSMCDVDFHVWPRDSDLTLQIHGYQCFAESSSVRGGICAISVSNGPNDLSRGFGSNCKCQERSADITDRRQRNRKRHGIAIQWTIALSSAKSSIAHDDKGIPV